VEGTEQESWTGWKSKNCITVRPPSPHNGPQGTKALQDADFWRRIAEHQLTEAPSPLERKQYDQRALDILNQPPPRPKPKRLRTQADHPLEQNRQTAKQNHYSLVSSIVKGRDTPNQPFIADLHYSRRRPLRAR
jgi:hypothetical protein